MIINKKLASPSTCRARAGQSVGFCVFWKKGSRFNILLNAICLVFSMMILQGCKEEEPEIIDTIQPGKRDYVWSIDSVDYGNLPSTIQLESIWGSSATDVWGAAGDAPDVRDCLWHYDGVK